MKKIVTLFATLLIVFSLCSCANKEPVNTKDPTSQTTTTQGFKAPENFAAVIKITINPTFHLYINKDGGALALEAVNNDAQAIINQINVANQSLESAVKAILSAANKGGFVKEEATVSFEVTQIKDSSLNTADLLNKASAAVNSAAAELNIDLTVGITQTSQETTTKTPTTKPTTKTPTTTKKPTTSQTTKAETFLNPKQHLPYDKEYAGYFRPEAENLIASGFAFYKEGGMDGGAFCLLLSPQFEPVKTDDGQTKKQYGGKTYYCVGAGQSPYNMELTDSEIIVKNSFYDETETVTFKLKLKTDNTFVVTYSQSADYPVGTVLSYFRG